MTNRTTNRFVWSPPTALRKRINAMALCAGLVAVPCAANEAAPTEPAPETEAKVSKKQRQKFEAALAILESSNDGDDIVRALKVLRRGFPRSRVALEESLGSDSFRRRTFALKVLGEEGVPEKDLPAVSQGLKDPHPSVRLAAVMATRKLGPEGFTALTEYLAREQHHNNLKMAIKTLQHWKDKAAVPHLVNLLKREKKATVQNFCVTALEQLSGERHGKDVAAWQEYLERERLRRQARKLQQGPELKESSHES